MKTEEKANENRKKVKCKKNFTRWKRNIPQLTTKDYSLNRLITTSRQETKTWSNHKLKHGQMKKNQPKTRLVIFLMHLMSMQRQAYNNIHSDEDKLKTFFQSFVAMVFVVKMLCSTSSTCNIKYIYAFLCALLLKKK
jgi:hypothetical protein